jgi:hypothetical protein
MALVKLKSSNYRFAKVALNKHGRILFSTVEQPSIDISVVYDIYVDTDDKSIIVLKATDRKRRSMQKGYWAQSAELVKIFNIITTIHFDVELLEEGVWKLTKCKDEVS